MPAWTDVRPSDRFDRRLVAALLACGSEPGAALELLAPKGWPDTLDPLARRLRVVACIRSGRWTRLLHDVDRGAPEVIEALVAGGADTLLPDELPSIPASVAHALSLVSSLIRAGRPDSARELLSRLPVAPEQHHDAARLALRCGAFDLAEAWADDEVRATLTAWRDGTRRPEAAESEEERCAWAAGDALRAGDLEAAWTAAHRATSLGGDAYFAGRVLDAITSIRTGRERGFGPDAFNGLFDGQADVLAPELAGWVRSQDPRAVAQIAELLETVVLPKLGGNRDPETQTWVDGGKLRLLSLRPGIRIEARRAQALWSFVGLEASVEAFEALAARRPRDPETWCYLGEVFLWAGDWARARASFEKALVIRRSTRWAWIGLGACDLFDGAPDRACDTFARGLVESGIPTPGPTMFVYRGEAQLRLGRLDEARNDLETSVRHAPTRIGGWLLLADLHTRAGRDADAARCLSEVRTRAPAFARDADAAAIAAHETFIDAGLRLLRGNRASARVTWLVGDEVCTNDVNDSVGRLLPTAAELMTALKAAPGAG